MSWPPYCNSIFSWIGVGWYILDDLIPSAIIGMVIHFIVLAFSFRISKRLFDKTHRTEKDL